jgi:hypothetical protein
VTDPRENHPLRHTLAKTEVQLQEAIEQVCEDTVVKESTTDELIRIEETLAIAAEAAKQAVSLRRRIRFDGEEQRPDA